MALQPAVFFYLYNNGKSSDSGSIQNALSQHLFVFQLVILLMVFHGPFLLWNTNLILNGATTRV